MGLVTKVYLFFRYC